VCFNPRARVGRDQLLVDYYIQWAKFQSTRPRGARLKNDKRLHEENRCFNPRARVGRDSLYIYQYVLLILFQSTRPRGARLRQFTIKGGTEMFQSTRPRGARHFKHGLREQA